MKPDFTLVTEVPGAQATREQFARLQQRYGLAAAIAAGRRVLEVACGSGIGLPYVARRASFAVGGDYTWSLLKLAHAHHACPPLIQLDAQSLPFADASFDAIYMFEALYYLPEPHRFLSESRRVLSPSGVLLIGIVNSEWSEFSPSAFSTRYLAARELATMLHQIGFASVQSFGSFETQPKSARAGVVSLARRAVVRLNLMPKTLGSRAFLKRLAYGATQPLPAAIEDTPEHSGGSLKPLLDLERPVREYKILYFLASTASTDHLPSDVTATSAHSS